VRCKLEDNIKIDLKEMGWEGVNWIHLAQDIDQWWVLLDTVMNLQLPYYAGNFLSSETTVSFSRKTRFHGISYGTM
jgi:hypothetical protein